MNEKKQLPVETGGMVQLHTIRDTCRVLKIGSTTCWKLIRNGSLQAVRLSSRCTRVTEASIVSLIGNGANPYLASSVKTLSATVHTEAEHASTRSIKGACRAA